ncbi:MAG: hypothetical protein OEY51_05705 [Cyclobacteriaceae bacterium]|nr:hypothetical protein [Cyclobacteriaceae bacterium]
MKKLKENWITQYPLDFEYNQYTLLAYLDSVSKEFNKVKIFPVLDELQQQTRELQRLRQNTHLLRDSFPKRVNRVDLINQNLVYEETVEVDKYIEHVERTVDFALPKIKTTYKEGSEIYTFVKKQCLLEPIGMLPLYIKEGYLFIAFDTATETSIYHYSLGLFESKNNLVPAVNIKQIDTVKKARTETYEFLKIKLIRKYKKMPNPATYLFLVQMKLPFEETVLPLAREFLVNYISQT